MGSTAVEFKNAATSTLLELVKNRRTYYGLKGESPISDDAIERIVQDSVLHVPSSFNTQTSRVVLLLKEEHQKVWDIAIKAIEGLVAAGHVPKESFETSTKPKLESFRAAYGTVRSYFGKKSGLFGSLTQGRSSSLLTTSLWLLSRRSSLSMPTSLTLSRLNPMRCPSTSVSSNSFSFMNINFSRSLINQFLLNYSLARTGV